MGTNGPMEEENKAACHAQLDESSTDHKMDQRKICRSIYNTCIDGFFWLFSGTVCKHKFSACCQGSKHSLFTWLVLLKIAETNECKETCTEMMML